MPDDYSTDYPTFSLDQLFADEPRSESILLTLCWALKSLEKTASSYSRQESRKKHILHQLKTMADKQLHGGAISDVIQESTGHIPGKPDKNLLRSQMDQGTAKT